MGVLQSSLLNRDPTCIKKITWTPHMSVAWHRSQPSMVVFLYVQDVQYMIMDHHVTKVQALEIKGHDITHIKVESFLTVA